MSKNMMNSFYNKNVFLMIVLLTNFAMPLNSGSGFKNNYDNTTKGTNGVLLSILINNDTDLSLQAGSYGWTGNGSQSSPFIIKNLSFNNTIINEPLILIQNTRLYFELRNISVLGGLYGLFLNNVSNAIINNVNISYSKEETLYLYDSENITIKNSYIFNSGVMSNNLLVDYSSNILIEHNAIFNGNSAGIRFRDSGNSQIINNSIYNNQNSGIVLGNCKNITITGNIIQKNIYKGLSIEGNSNVVNVTDNLFYNNYDCGVSIISINVSIKNNTFYNNSMYGLAIDISSFNINVLENNFIENNGEPTLHRQISDLSNNSVYALNYFSDYTGPDNDNNGIVDLPFQIIENATYYDQFPKTSVYLTSQIHILTKPNITPINNSITTEVLDITWGRASDTFNHSIKYSISVSKDNRTTWELITENVNSTHYLLNVTNLTDNTQYYVKIIAMDYFGFTSVAISNQFYIINPEPTETQQSSSTNSQTSSKTTTASISVYMTFIFLLICGLFINKTKKE